jgi:hypothetical protein
VTNEVLQITLLFRAHHHLCFLYFSSKQTGLDITKSEAREQSEHIAELDEGKKDGVVEFLEFLE